MHALSDGREFRTGSEWRAMVARGESRRHSEVAFCQKAKLSRQSCRVCRRRQISGDLTYRIRATRKARPGPAGFVEWVRTGVPGSCTTKRNRHSRLAKVVTIRPSRP